MNGKGRGPERGRNLALYRAGHEAINWRRPSAPPSQIHIDRKKHQPWQRPRVSWRMRSCRTPHWVRICSSLN